MKRFLITGFFWAVLALSDVYAQTFTNPVLAGDYPDPTIMRDGKDYYMTHSSMEYQPGLTVWHSRDLVNWEPISYGLKTYLGSVWAPDICKYGDTYYIYFTVATRPRSNYVVWAKSPYGPWSDPIDLHIGNIDPSHVVGEDGSRWLFMSRGKRVRLSDDGLSVVPGTEEVIYGGWPIPEEWITEGYALEGPKLRRIGRYYYYLNAEGGTAGPPTSHMVVQARSESVNGPWENAPGNPLIHTWTNEERWWSKGHGSLIDTPDGRWFIVYHSYENGFTNLGRQVLVEPLYLGCDGWFHRCDTLDVANPIACPIPGETSPKKEDKLSLFRLGLEWRFYKSFSPKRMKAADGTLTLQAQGIDPASSSPLLFISGRHRFQIEAEIELHGDVTAGFVLFYNEEFFQGTWFNRQNRFFYRKGTPSRSGKHDTAHLWLRLQQVDGIVTGWWSLDGKEWKHERWGLDCSGYAQNTLGGFQSVLPGLFAFGEGNAVFKNFKYLPLGD